MQGLMAAVRAAAGRPRPRRRAMRAGRARTGFNGGANRANQFRNPGPGSNSGSSGVSATYNLPQSLRQGAVRQDSFDATHIRKCEFIQNVTGTAAFTQAAAFAINPGIAATFPWLSTVAQSWEKFRFRKLVFHYITRTGNNVPGSVLFAPDYDASDAAPSSEQIASDYTDSDACPPYANPQTGHYVFPLNCARMNSVVQEHFIRTAPLAANQDIKLYDPANAFFFTNDGTAVAWGKIWVEYEVDLFTPQLPSAGLVPNGVSTFGSGTMTTTTGTTVNPLLAGVPQGSLVISQAGQVATVTGLIIGREYYVTHSAGPGVGTTTCNLNTPVGWTIKTALTDVGVATLCGAATYIATATTASITITLAAAWASGTFCVCEIPVATIR